MRHWQNTALVVWKTAFLALLGLGVVLLVGPVVAVVSVALSLVVVLLPFVLIGFMVWALFQAAVLGKPVSWEELRGQGGQVFTPLRNLGGILFQWLRYPWRGLAHLGAAITQSGGRVLRVLGSSARVAAEVSLITAGGVLVGALMGFLTASPTSGVEVAVPTNALIGGVLAAVVGIGMAVHERRAAVRQAPNGLS